MCRQSAPSFYKNEQNLVSRNISVNSQPDYEKISGIGLGLYHKIILFKSAANKLYLDFAYDGEYTYPEMSDKSFDWVAYYNDNLEYLRYDLISYREPINGLK